MKSTIERAAALLGKVDKAPRAVGTSPSDATVIAERVAPAVVELDLERLAGLGFATPGSKASSIAADIRRAKRRLLAAVTSSQQQDQASLANLIMVTSALPGEGKTFIAINLALSIAAEVDHDALLVDGDLAKGDASKLLGMEKFSGLFETLERADRGAPPAVISTDIAHLSVIPAGEKHVHTDELWASDFAIEFVQNLARARRDRLVIVDAPPLIATTESAVMAQIMGQVIVVVEADKTPQSAVADGLGQLEGHDNVSVLLNKASRSMGHHYGRYYRYGYDQED